MGQMSGEEPRPGLWGENLHRHRTAAALGGPGSQPQEDAAAGVHPDCLLVTGRRGAAEAGGPHRGSDARRTPQSVLVVRDTGHRGARGQEHSRATPSAGTHCPGASEHNVSVSGGSRPVPHQEAQGSFFLWPEGGVEGNWRRKRCFLFDLAAGDGIR